MPRPTLVIRDQEIRSDGSILEVVIWELPEPIWPCVHAYQYRLYFGAGGTCHVRDDNERGKDGSRPLQWFGDRLPVVSTLTALIRDFRQDIFNGRDA